METLHLAFVVVLAIAFVVTFALLRAARRAPLIDPSSAPCGGCGHRRDAHTFQGDPDSPAQPGAGACTAEVERDEHGAIYCDCTRFGAAP